MRIDVKLAGLLLPFSVWLFLAPSVAAQDAKQKAGEELERRQTLESKTYVLVDEIASGASGLKLPENRSFVLAAAADLMWTHNEKRARAIFWDALGSLNLMIPVSGRAGKEIKIEEAERKMFFATFALRQQLIRNVARRDPQLALDMMRATRQPIPEQIAARYNFTDDVALEQGIAAEAAARDPQRALQIARESLSKGLSFQLLDLLYRLNDRDSESGTKFAGEIIQKLQTSNLATDFYAARIGVDLMVSSRTRERIESYGQSKPLKLEKEQRREMARLIADTALSGSANGNLLYAVSEIMPEIEEFAPERVALLQRKIAAFNQTLNKEQKGWNEYNSLMRNGTPEEMLAASSGMGDQQRQVLQRQAIVLAVHQRRADLLRQFISAETSDEGRRDNLIDALDAEQINSAVSRGEAKELRKLLPQVRLKEERARAMAELAVVFEKEGDHEEAVKLLGEARTLIKADLDSETQTNALLALIVGYALVEPAKAFAIIERTIDRANDQITTALLLDKIVRSGIVKQGEIVLQNSGIIPFDFAVFKYGKGVAVLAARDFDRTKAAADRLHRNELRIMARLMLAEAVLRTDRQAGIKEDR